MNADAKLQTNKQFAPSHSPAWSNCTSTRPCTTLYKFPAPSWRLSKLHLQPTTLSATLMAHHLCPASGKEESKQIRHPTLCVAMWLHFAFVNKSPSPPSLSRTCCNHVSASFLHRQPLSPEDWGVVSHGHGSTHSKGQKRHRGAEAT